MPESAQYVPCRASGALIRKNGEKWTLILVRELRHPPEVVWEALTDPAQLSEWAPFDADRNLNSVGPMKLSLAGSPNRQVFENTVKRVEAPKLLEYTWGENDLRWELEPMGSGTRLTLWHNIDAGFIAWGAAGWHICFDILERRLAGEPVQRLAGSEAAKSGGWSRLVAEYAKQFGMKATIGMKATN